VQRRRLIGALGLTVALGALGLVGTTVSGAALPEMPRRHITLSKVCELSANDGPTFVIENVTDEAFGGPAQPETISVTIRDRYFLNGAGLTSGPIVVAPGEQVVFTAPAGWPWKSAYGPDFQYFAHFTAVNDKTGKVQAMKTHEYCACSNPVTTSSSSSTTLPDP